MAQYSKHGDNYEIRVPEHDLGIYRDSLTSSVVVRGALAGVRLRDDFLSRAVDALAQQKEKSLEQQIIIKQQKRLDELKEAVGLMRDEFASWNLEFPSGLLLAVDKAIEGES